MNFEPVINARFKNFRERHGLLNINDGTAFEHFVNFNVLYAHNPEPFLGNSDFLQLCNVGGSNDLAIDGIAIKLNGVFVREMSDVDVILHGNKRATVEFIFIQSKYKEKFEMGEFNNFATGVRDFLSETHLQPMNDSIRRMLEIKEYILSDEIMIMWESNPSVRLYYVTMGKKHELPHINALITQFEADILSMNTYENLNIHLVDSKALKDICDNNDNSYTEIIEIIDSMPLTAVEEVDNSCMALCYAPEIYKLLKTEDGVIRKSLFNDNVRDFQGETAINEEIEKTILDEPQKFVLLNNGITIVCDEYKSNNRKVTLVNPQVVNGCQTSHMIYFSKVKGIDISKVPVSIKIIATNNDHITGQVVRGTNKQNIVYDEAFETIRDFHKELEEFYPNIPCNDVTLYYERRSKQYSSNPTVKQSQKINFRSLTQGFIAMFLNEPENSYKHESRLIRDYKNKIFLDNHSKLPYYTTGVAFYFLDKFFRKFPELTKEHLSLKCHILMIAREIINPDMPSINKEKDIDRYCNSVIDGISEKNEDIFKNSIQVLNKCKEIWTTKMRRSIHGIKDVSEFTKLLIEQTSSSQKPPSLETGVVKRVTIDRNGAHCGFIQRSPRDIFFHSKSN
ncbi:AIPR family protein [Paenibacillus lautus]